MSLNWSLTAIENYKDLYEGNDEIGYTLKGPYESIVIGMTPICMDSITEKNWREVLIRLVIFSKLFVGSEREKTLPRHVRSWMPHVKRMIGLRVNVTKRTRKQWFTHMNNNLYLDVDRAVEGELKNAS